MEEVVRNLEGLKISDKNPNNPFPKKDIESVAELLKSGHFKSIALMVGAGISVNAGIPDFRSKGGLYDTLRQQGFPKPELIFDISFFKQNPHVFYEVAGFLEVPNIKPTLTHYFFRLLEQKGLLLRCFTQNIDSLELSAGLSKSKLTQAHGHMNSVRCVKCKTESTLKLYKQSVKQKEVLFCDHCKTSPVKPDVVFFGEQLGAGFAEEVFDLQKADLLLVIGTSLAVHPFAGLVTAVPKNTPRLLINKYIENAHNFQFDNPDVPDVALTGDCDETIKRIVELCGWQEELEVLVRNVSYFGALDFGTGSTRFIVFDNLGSKISSFQMELTQSFPGSNMHEQDPLEYVSTAAECIEKACQNIDIRLIKAVGISNQRETIIAWDKETGKPLHPAIIWDDARTGDICLEFSPCKDLITTKTGLPISTYFSATKIVWLIRNVEQVSSKIAENNCLFGTVETWAIYNLTTERRHVTDISNASRTMLMNLAGHWDEELLAIFKIPLTSLPKICSSSEVYGSLSTGILAGVSISGALGDQQAALLGHHCTEIGDTKCTYGTGAFLLMNTGNSPQPSNSGLLTTVFGRFGEAEEILYALEGAVECAGSSVKWARQLGFFNSFEELESLAGSVADCGGVYFVPALSGLFAPYWSNEATGILTGLTQHTTKAHICRAVLEGVCFRTAELLKALKKDAGSEIKALSVDGGMTNNKLFMKEQAEIAGVSVEIPLEKDLTALGAAYAAAIGIGIFKGIDDLKALNKKLESTVLSTQKVDENRWVNWELAMKKCLISKI